MRSKRWSCRLFSFKFSCYPFDLTFLKSILLACLINFVLWNNSLNTRFRQDMISVQIILQSKLVILTRNQALFHFDAVNTVALCIIALFKSTILQSILLETKLRILGVKVCCTINIYCFSFFILNIIHFFLKCIFRWSKNDGIRKCIFSLGRF